MTHVLVSEVYIKTLCFPLPLSFFLFPHATTCLLTCLHPVTSCLPPSQLTYNLYYYPLHLYPEPSSMQPKQASHTSPNSLSPDPILPVPIHYTLLYQQLTVSATQLQSGNPTTTNWCYNLPTFTTDSTRTSKYNIPVPTRLVLRKPRIQPKS